MCSPARRQMASVFQDPLLVDTTVFANVALGLRFRGLSRGDVAPRVARWMERLGDRPPGRTAGAGMLLAARRSARRSLSPRLHRLLLLLDEPFAALDQPSREALIVELGRILRHDRITTVLVTHDRGEALALGDRVAAMMDGHILQIDEGRRGCSRPRCRRPWRASWAWRPSSMGAWPRRGMGWSRSRSGRREGGGRRRARPGRGPGAPLRQAGGCDARPPGAVFPPRPRNQLMGTVTELLPAGTQVRARVDCGFPAGRTGPRTPRSRRWRWSRGRPWWQAHGHGLRTSFH